jgi:3-oxoacyl-[acyl-carrier protein] reductase
MFDLCNKNAIVTGGARGLGKEFVIRMLEAGSSVCIADVNVETGQKTLKEIQERFGDKRVIFVQSVSLSMFICR